MHAYLKTIGFSKIKTTKELQEILRDVVENYDRKRLWKQKNTTFLLNFRKEYAYDCGITVCGEMMRTTVSDGILLSLFRGRVISSYEEVSVERRCCLIWNLLVGACDDMRLGITMIFYLTHAAEHFEMKQKCAAAACSRFLSPVQRRK